MRSKGLGINAYETGIGATVHQHLLMVPPNQRSYAWEETHVRTLFEDFSGALAGGEQPYFLGTLVLTEGDDERLEVADGQQRLATTSILIAAIRDYLEGMGTSEKRAAEKYTSEYLLIYDEMTGEHIPKLQLNYEDNDYFLNQILKPLSVGTKVAGNPATPSHERLYRAAAVAKGHVDSIVSQFSTTPANRARELYKWIRFLRDLAIVISIRVPDDVNAYTMFETLNDRGLRASQTDILKNYLFGKAQDQLSEIQMKWLSMVSAIETVGDEELLITYIRHNWTLTHGYTAERELAALVKNDVTGRQQALDMVIGLDNNAPDYTGLFTPLEYVGWPTVDKETRAYIFIVTRILAIEQILPLILAVLQKFEPPQAKAAMKLFLSWSVRFLVAGSGGGGPLDRAYGQLAKEVAEGTVRSANQLKDRVRAGVLRTNSEFAQAFSKARVTKAALARYYLRALELHMENDPRADLGGTLDDSFVFNVEHVMPQRESPNWPIPEQIAQQFRKRLGNMVLLNPGENVQVGNKTFAEKRPAYARCPLLLTQEVASYLQWTPTEIDDWQEKLAARALMIWPE